MTVEHHHSSNLHSSEPHSTAHSTAGHSTAAHSTDNALNHVIIEFYEKLSSWEHAIVRDKGFSLSQVHTIELLGVHGAMRMKELADKIGVTTAR